MPLTQYNVDATNNQVYFNIGGTDYTAAIDIGSYNVCTLCAELIRVMNLASSATFDVWFDSGGEPSKPTVLPVF